MVSTPRFSIDVTQDKMLLFGWDNLTSFWSVSSSLSQSSFSRFSVPLILHIGSLLDLHFCHFLLKDRLFPPEEGHFGRQPLLQRGSK